MTIDADCLKAILDNLNQARSNRGDDITRAMGANRADLVPAIIANVAVAECTYAAAVENNISKSTTDIEATLKACQEAVVAVERARLGQEPFPTFFQKLADATKAAKLLVDIINAAAGSSQSDRLIASGIRHPTIRFRTV